MIDVEAVSAQTFELDLLRFDGEVHVQEGTLLRWAERSDGRELGSWDTEIASFGRGLTVEQHELSFWVPDDAVGQQSVRLVYTIAPY